MIGIYGGIFDPVHFGHLTPARDIQQQLDLSAVYFVPCHFPVHRDDCIASNDARLGMLQAALEKYPSFFIDQFELSRNEPSYMIDTLEYFHGRFPDETLCLMMGMDAFEKFDQWRQVDDILALTHVAVSRRPGSESMPGAKISEQFAGRFVNTVAELTTQHAGKIIFCGVTALDISSSDIRQKLTSGESLEGLVPPSVGTLIKQNHWYI